MTVLASTLITWAPLQAAAGDARAALAALLVGVDARRRCDFLELVTAGMHAGLLFFERGHQARKRCCCSSCM